jgi:hypothetical protein
LLGWSGWLLLLAVIGLLVRSRRLPVRHAPDFTPPAVRVPPATSGVEPVHVPPIAG